MPEPADARSHEATAGGEQRIPWDRLRFESIGREEWSAGSETGELLTISSQELADLRALNDPVDVREVVDVYLPLRRLLDVRINAHTAVARQTDSLLRRSTTHGPFIVGIAGSVAAGKSTTARLLQVLLSRAREDWNVELITTDGFLLPNAELERRGLMRRKGFPESYDVGRLLRFLAAVKRGVPRVAAPVYSHLRYDVQADERQWVERPDVLVLEGLNVLQTARGVASPAALPVFVSDFFDFGIYVHADQSSLRDWYVERFLSLRETAFRRPESYFRRFAELTVEEARHVAGELWEDINLPNLESNIAPTLPRADLVLEKDADHRVRRVRLRRG